jgi:hypothetical protein
MLHTLTHLRSFNLMTQSNLLKVHIIYIRPKVMSSKERKMPIPIATQIKIAEEKVLSAEQSIRRQHVAIQEAQQNRSFVIANNGQKWIPKLEENLAKARVELEILQENAFQANVS